MAIPVFLLLMPLMPIAGFAGTSFAAPAPLEYMVNDAARQCAQFSAGDECTRCAMPQGWKGIGMAPCPAGYATIEVPANCTILKSEFCCTAGHSGGNGDCSELLINPGRRECVFSDEARCAPSFEWAPAKDLCPEGYSWSDSTCSSGGCVPQAVILAAIAVISIFIMPGNGRG